jgi:hypothetical protein
MASKRRADAATRRFLDEFERVRISRFRALGVVDPSRPYAKIPFPNGKIKLIYTYHRKLKYGGGWSFFLCPGCSKRTPVLYLIDDMPRCARCCKAMNIHYRSRYGFGVDQRLEARQRALDELIRKLESGERLRVKTPASWGGKAQFVYNSRRLTMRMRRAMIAMRLNQLAGNGTSFPSPSKPAKFTPRQDAATLDLTAIWRARTTEQLHQALDHAQGVMLDALKGDDKTKRLAAARLLLRSRQGRELFFGPCSGRVTE